MIEQECNQGPAINRNIAVAAGNNPYAATLDDDTYPKDTCWLEKGMEFMQTNSGVGQIAAMIVSGFEPNVLPDCGILKNQYLFGGIFALELIGGFDEKYFYPADDLDVGMRLHLAGYDVRYEPSLLVSHYESQAMGKSLSRKMYMYRRNCLLTLIENFPLLHSCKMLVAVLVREVLYPLVCCVRGFFTLKKQNTLPDSVKDYIKTGLFLMKNSVAIIQKRAKMNRYLKRSRGYLLQVNKELIRNLAS